MLIRNMFLATLTTFIAFYTLDSNASRYCEDIESDPCGSTKYAGLYLDDATPMDDPCALQLRCVAAHEPPESLSLVCTRTADDFQCEAWPQQVDESFTYDWFATDALTATGGEPSDSPLQTIACDPSVAGGNGFVSVVVTSPFGLSSTHFQALSCN